MPCPHEGMSTSALIDKMFEGVLQAADREEDEEKEQGNEHMVSESRQEANVETAETEPNSPNPSPGGDEGACDREQKECKKNSDEEDEVAGEESAVCNEEDFLCLPPSILSPLSKSVEAVVTPMVRKFKISVDISSYIKCDQVCLLYLLVNFTLLFI